MQGELEGSSRYRELTRSAQNFFKQSVASKSRWGLGAIYKHVHVTEQLTSECICLNVPIVYFSSVLHPRVRRFSSCCTAANPSTWRSWRNKSHSSPKRTVSENLSLGQTVAWHVIRNKISKCLKVDTWKLTNRIMCEKLWNIHCYFFRLAVRIRDITPLLSVIYSVKHGRSLQISFWSVKSACLTFLSKAYLTLVESKHCIFLSLPTGIFCFLPIPFSFCPFGMPPPFSTLSLFSNISHN